MATITKYATWVDLTYTTKQRLNIEKWHVKSWDHLENLKTSGKQALCRDTSIGTALAGKNGTYNDPGAIYLSGFEFDFPSSTKIEKVIVHYGHQKYSTDTGTTKYYPEIAGAKISLYVASGIVASQTGAAIPQEYTKESVTFTDVSVDTLNNNEFGIIINYPPNTAETTGYIGLGDVYLEVITDSAEINLEAINKTTPIYNGSTFDVNFKVSRTDDGKDEYKPSLLIEYSDGIDFSTKKDGTGAFNVHDDDKKLYWDLSLNNNNKGEVTATFKTIKQGTQTITISDPNIGTKYTLTVTVGDYYTGITSNLADLGTDVLTTGKTATNEINVVTTTPNQSYIVLDIHFPVSFELENGNELANMNNASIVIDDTTGEQILNVTVPLTDGKGSIQLSYTFNDSGLFNQVIFYNKTAVTTANVRIKPAEYEHMAFTRVLINDTTVLNAMGTGRTYKAFSDIRYVADTTKKFVIENHYHNLRFGVYNNSNEYITDEKEFLKHVYWSNIAEDTTDMKRVTFTYNDDNPLYFVWTQEYSESENYEILNVEFCEPVLIEAEYYNGWEAPALYPSPPQALLEQDTGDVNYADVTVPFDVTTNPVLLYDFSDGGIFNNLNYVCQGFQCHWRYNCVGDVNLILRVIANLTDKTGKKITKYGKRNITLHDGAGVKQIGDQWDLFGLKPNYLRENLESLELEVSLLNHDLTDCFTELTNFYLITHYMAVDNNGYGFEINGERSEEYGIFLTDIPQWDWGTKNDVQYYQTSGTDLTTAYRSNVEKKEITLEFQVGDCDLIESGILLEKVTKLFTNERDKYNKPTPKTLIFDHIPDYAFKVVREDPIEVEVNTTYYTGKIKLTVPSGTAESVSPVVTGSTGATTGLASVTPQIIAIILEDGEIIVTENYTGAVLKINNDNNLKIGTRINIDSSERKVWTISSNGTKRLDMTSLVDWSSTWFSVLGEYDFQAPKLNIKQVTFNERI